MVMEPKNLLREAKSPLWEFDDQPDDKVSRPACCPTPPTSCSTASETHCAHLCEWDPSGNGGPGSFRFPASHVIWAAQGIKGVRFKRVIMDESATDRSPNPPTEEGVKRLVFCSGKVAICLTP